MLDSDPRSQLLDALEDARDPSTHWQRFMALVHGLAPDVFSRGRPSADAIRDSFIGQAGFKSWREMLETPVEQGGLGWSWSAWRQWSRAWATLQEHPGIADAGLTPAQTNRLAEKCRNQDVPIPEAPEAAMELLKRPKPEPRPVGPTNTPDRPVGLLRRFIRWIRSLFGV